MRTSKYPLSTLKENPVEASIVSHRLMVRAGLIRQVASGIYTILPTGFRVLRKVQEVIRQELEAKGCIELLLPVVQPAELWQESGRYDQYGPELCRFKDRKQNDFVLGPTHEEIITAVARREIKSARQLPVNLYQIQIKFRDEIRPRFGIMRGREFIMCDAYSFHTDQASLRATYEDMYDAYSKIFTRLGLNFKAVQADTGAIGGSSSHEFQVLAEAGEDTIAYCEGSDYAANIEMAPALPPSFERPKPNGLPLDKKPTPGCHTVDEAARALGIESVQVLKSLVVHGSDKSLVMLCLCGNQELNEVKAGKIEGIACPVEFATEEEIKNFTGATPGSLGPVGFKGRVIVDCTAEKMANFACGANDTGFHYVNANFDTDIKNYEVHDIRNVQSGDPSPCGKGILQLAKGIEVGQVFMLGTKYSKAMNCCVQDENGQLVPMEMGCYGIGVTRILAAAIEQHHDERGIIWPDSMAPFAVAIIAIGKGKSQAVSERSERLYSELCAKGAEVLFDDRDERPGVMFADMELIGIPHVVVIGEKSLAQGMVEYKNRRSGEKTQVKEDAITGFLMDKLGIKS